MALREWKTLYESLKGKKYKITHTSILKEAKDNHQQRAVLGLILYHSSLEGKVDHDHIPYGIKETDEGVEIDPEKIPKEVMVKIYQMLSK